MDQLKKFLAVIKKQHFWILTVLAVLLGLIVYFTSSSKLIEAYQQQKQKIAGIDSQVTPLLGSTQHPNVKWVEEVHRATNDLQINVYEAWKSLYNDQLKRVFIWPADLGPEVIAQFSQPAGKDDPHSMIEACERYQKFVKTEVRRMGAIVDADWPEKEKAEGHAPQVREPDADSKATSQKTYLVRWDDSDQKKLLDNYDWQDRPSPLDVRYAQEELWVMKAICEAIARTNEGAKLPDEALVHDINQMLIGYDAVSKFPLGEGENRLVHLGRGPVMAAPTGRPTDASQASSFDPKRPDRHKGTGDENDAGVRVAPGIRGGVPAGGPPGAADVADSNAWLKDGRFVSPQGRALTAKELQNPPVAQYNLMGFRLNLVVDELRWEKLLLELANSPLPLEVREVRVNTGGDSNNARHSGGRRNEVDSSAENGPAHNITVELRGVAYLINPPNPASLGLPEGSGAAPGTPPAAAGSTAPAPGGTAPATPATGGSPGVAVPPPTIATPPTTAPAVPPGGPPASAPPATPPTSGAAPGPAVPAAK